MGEENSYRFTESAIRLAAEDIGREARRVAVQIWPREAVVCGSHLVWALEELLEKETQVYLLMDTMRPGVVDVIGAAHVEAEVIVYFGGEGVKALPNDSFYLPRIVHVPDCWQATTSSENKAKTCADLALKALEESEASSLVVLYTPRWEALANEAAKIIRESNKVDQTFVASKEGSVNARDSLRACGLCVEGTEAVFRSRGVLFLGSPHVAAEISLRCAANSALILIDPESCQFIKECPSRRLARRHHRLELASTAKRWGVVVADVGRLEKLATATDDCCDWIEQSGERSAYVLALGVPTPTKLAHFAELEAFVLIGADAAMLEALAADFSAKPIITASELRVALRIDTWLPEDRPFYSSDLRDLATTSTAEEPDEPHFNLATAARRTILEYDNASTSDEDEYADSYREQKKDILALRAPNTLALSTENALGFLRNRQYQGLDPSVEGIQAQAAQPGDFGIAAAYSREEEEEEDTPRQQQTAW